MHKQLVVTIAMALIAQNGKTTTLEVKNEAHLQNSNDPSFQLTQNEVSTFMSEMFREANGEVSREFTGTFYEYSMTPAATAGIATVAPVHKTHFAATSSTSGTRNAPADAADNLGSVDTNNDADGELYVAFEVQNPDGAYLFDTKNPYAARAGYKKVVPSAVHENIRFMQLKNYLNKYVTA